MGGYNLDNIVTNKALHEVVIFNTLERDFSMVLEDDSIEMKSYNNQCVMAEPN